MARRYAWVALIWAPARPAGAICTPVEVMTVPLHAKSVRRRFPMLRSHSKSDIILSWKLIPENRKASDKELVQVKSIDDVRKISPNASTVFLSCQSPIEMLCNLYHLTNYWIFIARRYCCKGVFKYVCDRILSIESIDFVSALKMEVVLQMTNVTSNVHILVIEKKNHLLLSLM